MTLLSLHRLRLPAGPALMAHTRWTSKGGTRTRACATVLACACTFAFAPTLHGQTSLFYDGTARDATGAVEQTVTGLSLTGMTVNWRYTDVSEDEGVWGDLGGGWCGVDAGGFKLTLGCATNTSGGTWTFSNLTDRDIVRVWLNGASANVAFDCGFTAGACQSSTMGTDVGTPGSGIGQSLIKVGGSTTQDGQGLYQHVVGVNGLAPVGDLFEQFDLSFDFVQPFESYEFRLDADAVTYTPDDLAPTPPGSGLPVPEPATRGLLLASLLSLVLMRKQRKARRT